MFDRMTLSSSHGGEGRAGGKAVVTEKLRASALLQTRNHMKAPIGE